MKKVEGEQFVVSLRIDCAQRWSCSRTEAECCRESDVIMLLPTMLTPSDTSSLSWTTRLFLRGLTTATQFYQSAEVGDHAASTRSERSSAADSWPIYRWTNTWHQLWGSSTGCPSTVEWISNCAPWCTQSTPVSVRRILPTWCVAVNQMKSGLRSADTSGSLAWNDLPPSLHCITDLKRFRKHLKTHYFNRTFVETL